MLLPLLFLSRIHKYCACVATVPGGPGVPGVPACNCRQDLYDTSLCPPMGQCYLDPNAVVYNFGVTCTASLMCPSDYFIRFQLANGQFVNNIAMSLYTNQQHRLECRNQQWFYLSPRAPTGELISHLVCYERPIETPYASRQAPKAHSASSCKVCSSVVNSSLCPQKYKCSEPSIGSSNDGTSDCNYSVIECPGSDLLVQLKSGSSMIVYPEDVQCDGEWIFDDGRRSHRIESMTCLIRVSVPETPSNCKCSYPPPREICTTPNACTDITAGNSLDGCSMRIRCQKGNHLVIRKRQEDGGLNAREQVVAGNNPLLLCTNGNWLVNNNDREFRLEENETIFCEEPTNR
ncbi:hypothetical protein RB195_014291 [Necator americanus]|uniref:CUB domain-containing protein n=1 Tax=Necator americanus TaxID=51031 RepID=A0ABR1DZI1_NECAM